MKKFFTLSFVLVFGLILMGGQIYGKTIYVYPGDKIQEAIDDAVNGDLILIYDGIYKDVGNRNLDFSTKTIHVRSVYGPNNCIIDCEHLGRGFNFVQSGSNVPWLGGITIKNGQTTDDGGGIFIRSSSPIIENMRIDHCSADGNGGGIAVGSYSTPQIKDCKITYCQAERGGGMYLNSYSQNTITVENCYFMHNTAFNKGGGMYIQTDKSTMKQCYFYNNNADLSGGGVYIENAYLTNFLDTWVVKNQAGGSGGGIEFYNCFWINMGNTTIYMNEAVDAGGGIYVYNNNPIISYLHFDNGYIYSNTAEKGGGILVALNTYVDLNYSQVINNANYGIYVANLWPGVPYPEDNDTCDIKGNKPQDKNY